MRVPELAERQAIAAIPSSPRRLLMALVEASGAAVVVEDRIEARDRDAGWAAGAGLVQPRAMSSAVCTDCGHKIAHVAGQPCSQQVCPSCNARMTRV